MRRCLPGASGEDRNRTCTRLSTLPGSNGVGLPITPTSPGAACDDRMPLPPDKQETALPVPGCDRSPRYHLVCGGGFCSRIGLRMVDAVLTPTIQRRIAQSS